MVTRLTALSIELLGGSQVWLAPLFVLVFFSFVEGSWSAFWSFTWEDRFATWGRNLCLIGCGATIEFLIHHSELRNLLIGSNVQLPLHLSPVDVPAFLVILLLLGVPTSLVATVKARVKPMTAWAGISSVFIGGIVMSLPLVIRFWFTH